MSVTLLTSLGDLKVELFAQEVPKLSENFLALLASGTYSGTVFHRLMPGFIIQGGDPTGTGKGGECVWGGVLPDDFGAPIRHDQRGVVSMANGGPDGNGSQFFITYTKAMHLNMKYTVFGKVIHGWDVIDALEKQQVGEKDRPLHPAVIESVTIHANPIADLA